MLEFKLGNDIAQVISSEVFGLPFERNFMTGGQTPCQFLFSCFFFLCVLNPVSNYLILNDGIIPFVKAYPVRNAGIEAAAGQIRIKCPVHSGLHLFGKGPVQAFCRWKMNIILLMLDIFYNYI